jgi:hypothetical protein
MPGRIQRQVFRALIAGNGQLLQTIDFLQWSYPRLTRWKRWHYKSAYRAAERVAERVGKDARGRIVWRLREH